MKSRLLALLVPLLLLTGCWQTVAVNSRSIVLGVSVDKGKSPGSSLYTFQMPTPTFLEGLGAQAGAGSGPSFFTISTEARSFTEAIVLAENTSSRDLYLGQLAFILVSDQLPATTLASVLEEEARTGELDHTEYLLAAHGSAKDLMTMEVIAEDLPSLYVQSHFSCHGCSEEDLSMKLYEALNQTMEPTTDLVLPVLEKSDKNLLQISRVLVYKRLSPVAILSPTQTKGWAWLTRRMTKEVVVVKTAEGTGAIRNVAGGVSVNIKKEASGKPYLDVRVSARGAVALKPGQASSASFGVSTSMARAAASTIRQEILAAIRLARSQGAEPFGIGPRVKASDPAVYGSPGTWRETFRQLPVRVSVRVALPSQGAHT